nr:MAG TPA: hypothetical protein [Caudoviricetes sp.]
MDISATSYPSTSISEICLSISNMLYKAKLFASFRRDF